VNNDQWAIGILRRFGYKPQLLFDDRRKRELWERALTRRPDDVDYKDSFYRAEFERVVLPQGCESAEDYMRASRVGRGQQLSRADRQKLWPVFAEYRAQLRGANLREPEEAYRDALALLRKEGANLGVRSIVVDETQDLSPAALALLRAAVPAGQNDMFLVGDAHQRIYRHRATLSKVGIDIRGRGRRLRINYRTTDEIRKWATARLVNCAIDDLDGQPDTLVGYKSLTHGAAPDDGVVTSRDAEREIIGDALSQLEGGGIADRRVCIVVRTNEEAVEFENWLQAIGRAALRLDREVNDDQSVAGVRVATMHRVKGLEFDAVIIAGYKGPEELARLHAEDTDAGVYVDTLTNERCLLHVAATRAKRYLMARTLAAK
jgi:superfamily I DNA/RNA helicase